MKRGIFFTVVMLLVTFHAAAQQNDAKAELAKIREYYAGNALVHLGGQMVLKKNAAAIDKVDFDYWVKGKQFFAKMNYIEILNNDEVYIMVNHKSKTIYGRPLSELTQQAGIGFLDPLQIQNALNAKGVTASVVKNGSGNSIRITGLQNSAFSSMVINYTDAYKITTITAAVHPGDNNESLILDIKYAVNEKSGTEKNDVFSAAKYISKTGKDKYTYTKTYHSYQKL